MNTAPAAEEPEFFERPDAPLEEQPEAVFISVSDLVAAVSQTPEPAAEQLAYDLSFLETIDFPLPDISSEDLEHADDDWLDNAYELRLQSAGDSLHPVANAAVLVETLLQKKNGQIPDGNSNGTSAAAPALEFVPYSIPQFEEEPEMEAPVLSANPTEEELIAFAKSNRTVRTALKIFRGTIKEVRKR